MEFEIDTDHIELIKLLKAVRIAESGGMAKIMVETGMVKRNGETETRKRAKLIPGDIIEIEGRKIKITTQTKTCDSTENNISDQ